MFLDWSIQARGAQLYWSGPPSNHWRSRFAMVNCFFNDFFRRVFSFHFYQLLFFFLWDIECTFEQSVRFFSVKFLPMRLLHVCVCVSFLLPSKQNQRGGDVTGWKGGLQNECQFIETRPHSHTQHVLRNLEWREWKSTYTKYQRLTMDKLQWCFFCLMPDIN